MESTTNTSGFKCCQHCINNPKNNPHATGFCNCVLPTMEMHGSTVGTVTGSTTTLTDRTEMNLGPGTLFMMDTKTCK